MSFMSRFHFPSALLQREPRLPWGIFTSPFPSATQRVQSACSIPALRSSSSARRNSPGRNTPSFSPSFTRNGRSVYFRAYSSKKGTCRSA